MHHDLSLFNSNFHRLCHGTIAVCKQDSLLLSTLRPRCAIAVGVPISNPSILRRSLMVLRRDQPVATAVAQSLLPLFEIHHEGRSVALLSEIATPLLSRRRVRLLLSPPGAAAVAAAPSVVVQPRNITAAPPNSLSDSPDSPPNSPETNPKDKFSHSLFISFLILDFLGMLK